MGKLVLNSTQIPNIIFDQFMAKMSHAEFKIVMAVARKTYGWHKDKDRISLTQIIELTGVSRQKILDSIKSLDWLIESHQTGSKSGKTNTYSIKLGPKQSSEWTADQSSELTGSSLVSGLGESSELTGSSLVSGLTKERLKETIQKKKTPADSGDKPERELTTLQTFIEWWKVEYKKATGHEYKVYWNKDANLVSRLLTFNTLEELQATALALLNTKDRWLAANRTIGILSSHHNQIIQAAPRSAASTQPEGYFYSPAELAIMARRKKAS